MQWFFHKTHWFSKTPRNIKLQKIIHFNKKQCAYEINLKKLIKGAIFSLQQPEQCSWFTNFASALLRAPCPYYKITGPLPSPLIENLSAGRGISGVGRGPVIFILVFILQVLYLFAVKAAVSWDQFGLLLTQI